MISSRAHLLESYLCATRDPEPLPQDSRASSTTTETSTADEHMRFLGDGEALCVPVSGLPFSRSTDSLMPSNLPHLEQNRNLHLKNRLLWEENRRLSEEVKRLKAQIGQANDSAANTRACLKSEHPVLHSLLLKHAGRAGSICDAITMLGQADKERILTFAPHGIRHVAVQLLLWTFYLESKADKGGEQPIKLIFDKPGGNPDLYKRATEWFGHLAITDAGFQKSAQELVDSHLKTEQPVNKPSEYNSAILQQIMMRYPEVKDMCLFASDIVEKQCKVIGQLTTCII